MRENLEIKRYKDSYYIQAKEILSVLTLEESSQEFE